MSGFMAASVAPALLPQVAWIEAGRPSQQVLAPAYNQSPSPFPLDLVSMHMWGSLPLSLWGAKWPPVRLLLRYWAFLAMGVRLIDLSAPRAMAISVASHRPSAEQSHSIIHHSLPLSNHAWPGNRDPNNSYGRGILPIQESLEINKVKHIGSLVQLARSGSPCMHEVQ
jgi:hypothetical protein